MPRRQWSVWAFLLCLSVAIHAQTEKNDTLALPGALETSTSTTLPASTLGTTLPASTLGTTVEETTIHLVDTTIALPFMTTIQPEIPKVELTTDHGLTVDLLTSTEHLSETSTAALLIVDKVDSNLNSSKPSINPLTKTFPEPIEMEVNEFLHPSKPEWGHIQPSEPDLDINDSPPLVDELIAQVTNQIAGYINSQLILEPSSISLNDIVEKLRNKLNDNTLRVNDQERGTLRVTAKLTVTNLLYTINAMILENHLMTNEMCSSEFYFLDRIYCIKFEINRNNTKSLASKSQLSGFSVQAYEIYKSSLIETPPSTWQKWLDPTRFLDQPSTFNTERPVVCYYTNWAQYRNGPGRFYPENMDTNLCTHIIFAFAQLRDGVIAAYEWNDESTAWSTGMYARMMKLRQRAPAGLAPKILLAVGGWNLGSGKFSDMVQDRTKHVAFITSVISFLQKHEFDGLDVDWEYPGSREGSRPTDKQLYTQLLSELKTAFRPFNYLLTAAVGAGKPTIDAAYEIPQVCQYLDLVNLMAYDLHGSWEAQTGINSPLYAAQNDTALNKQLTQDWAVRYWLDNGCPPSKLVLGLATYGRTFLLASSSKTGIGAPAVGPGAAGLYTGEAGFLAYYEICTRIQQQGWTKVYVDEQKSNYAYKGQEWVGFDDAYTIAYKVRYAQEKQLAGIMFWAPDLDDFTGELCNEGKYPIMTTAVNVYRGQSSQPTTSTSTTTMTTSTWQPTPPTTVQPGAPLKKRIVCYYTNWAQYRPDDGKFFPENLDASLCTHVIFAFAVLKDSKLAPFEWNDEDMDWSKGMYTRLVQLKQTNDIKVSLAVGGWNFGSGQFSDMVNNEGLRKAFVQQATQFIRDHKFDGLDLDWEYPASRDGSRPEDKQAFTTLVKELYTAFRPYNLMLTAAVGAGKETIEKGYEIDQLALYLDSINLMTYDFHGGSWENKTGLHTALYARPEETGDDAKWNTDWAVNHWISSGMPKEKISMGLATYGRTFELVNPDTNSVGAPAVGPGTAGPYTREPGFLSYYEICEKLNSGKWTSAYDDVQKSMYAYGEDMWVGYDNVDTLTIRANYINKKGLGGVMFWTPDLDDFSGKFCERGRYPLMNAVVNLIRSGTIVTVPISGTSTGTAITSTVTMMTTVPLPTITQASSTLPTPIRGPSSVVACMMMNDNPSVLQTFDGKACSHLIVVQTSPAPSTIDPFTTTLPSSTVQQLQVLRRQNPNLRVLYSILGFWRADHIDLIRNVRRRQNFNRRIRQYLLDNGLNGLDIDWNVLPEELTSPPEKSLLSTWLTELRTIFDVDQFLLTIGVSGDKTVIDSNYDFINIALNANFIRLMAFDWKPSSGTAFINPLYGASDSFNNINRIIKYLTTLGIPPQTVTLGLPTFGRFYQLANGNDNGVGAAYVDAPLPLSYSEICKILKISGYTKAYDRFSRSSYAYSIEQKQWVTFTTEEDIALRARVAKLEEIAGVSLFLLDFDDITNQCGQGPYPLLNAVASIFGSNGGNPADLVVPLVSTPN